LGEYICYGFFYGAFIVPGFGWIS